MLDFIDKRLQRWGPAMGLDPQRFKGENSLETLVNQAMTDLDYLLEAPLNESAGETMDGRRAVLQSTFSSILAAVDREAGVQWSGVDWSNFRTRLGASLSMTSAVAYEVGAINSVHALAGDFSSNWFHVPFVAANTMFAAYHVVGAVSGRRQGPLWTELPIVRQTMNRVAWPLVSIGTGGMSIAALHDAAIAASNGNWGEVGFRTAQFAFAGVVSHATAKLAQAGWRAEGDIGLSPTVASLAKGYGFSQKVQEALEYGGVDVPRASAHRNVRAALGLIGLGALSIVQQLTSDDETDRGRKHVPVTPGGSQPVPSDSPSAWTPSPTPTAAQPSTSPTPTSTTTATVAPTPTPTATPTSTPPERPPGEQETKPERPKPPTKPPPKDKPEGQDGDQQREPIFVTVNGKRRQTSTLWGIAEANVDTLLTKKEERKARQAGGHNAVTYAALKELVQINPQRHFRLDLMDGEASHAKGDPDVIQNGWHINVNRLV
jgi:hypothetical protein